MDTPSVLPTTEREQGWGPPVPLAPFAPPVPLAPFAPPVPLAPFAPPVPLAPPGMASTPSTPSSACTHISPSTASTPRTASHHAGHLSQWPLRTHPGGPVHGVRAGGGGGQCGVPGRRRSGGGQGVWHAFPWGLRGLGWRFRKGALGSSPLFLLVFRPFLSLAPQSEHGGACACVSSVQEPDPPPLGCV